MSSSSYITIPSGVKYGKGKDLINRTNERKSIHTYVNVYVYTCIKIQNKTT